MSKKSVILVDGDLPLEWYESAKGTSIGVDIETSGLNKQTDRIACIQIYVPDTGTIMVRNLNNAPMALLALLINQDIQKIFHHALFDLAFLMRDYPYIRPRNIADTMIAAKLFDPRKERFFHPITGNPSHSLIALVWYYKQIILDKSLATSNWFQKKLTKSQLDYAAKDVIYLPYMLAQMEQGMNSDTLELAHSAYECIPTQVALQLHGYDNVFSR